MKCSRRKKIIFSHLKGFSLIELLISFVIGLFVTAAVIVVFINAKSIHYFQTDFSKIQENIIFLNQYLPRIIRQAGYRASPTSGKFTDFTTTFSTTPYITGVNGNSTTSDSITLAYQGSGTPPDGKIKDCLNRNVGATSIATSKFYVDSATGKLKCDANNPDASPQIKTDTLISGVDSFQILYGEDLDSDGVPNRYLSAGSTALDMSRVVSIKISILLKSSNPSNFFTDTKQYSLLDVTNYQPGGTTGDKYLRIPVTYTIVLRNLIPR